MSAGSAPNARNAALQICGAVVLVTLLCWLSKSFTRDGQNLSTVWLANGLLLGLMLTAPTRRWPWLLGAGLVGNVLASHAVGDIPVALWNSAFGNTLEVALAAIPLRRGVNDAVNLARPRPLARFVVFGMLLAPAISGGAIIGSGYLFFDLSPNLQAFRTWFIAHSLGMATTVPVVIAFQNDGLKALLERKVLPETLALLGLLVGVLFLVFGQSKFPLMFLVYPPLLMIAMRAGFAATALGILLVVLIAVGATTMGQGPLRLIEGASRAEQLIFLQVFIAVLLLTLFPIVVALSERRRALITARENQARYRLLAEHATDVVILTTLDARRLYVSPAVEEIFGWTPEEFLRLSYRDMAHPDDLESLTHAIFPDDENWTKLTVVYRARRKDGKEVWVEAQMCRFEDELISHLAASAGHRNPSEAREGRVVTLRDITRRRATEQALELANQELASLVWKDGLTGIANRRRFDDALRHEWARCTRDRSPLAVIMIDVDFFKIYNDRYGHQLGDRALVSVSDAIVGALYRPSDLAARYGGEEFAVLLPGVGVEAAVHVAERVHAGLIAKGIEHAGSPLGIVTVSLGVAVGVPEPGQTPVGLVRAADEALYSSKRAGRNRVSCMQLRLALPEENAAVSSQ